MPEPLRARLSATIGEIERLVTRTRDAQRRPVHLNAAQLEQLTAWIDKYRLIHEQRFRDLDSLLTTINGAGRDGRAATKEDLS